MKKILVASLMTILMAAAANAQFASTGTTTLSVTIGPEAALQVTTATTTLAAAGSIFNNYTGTTSLTYKIRTTNSTGAGTITLRVTTDFSPANGPSVASPPSPGDTLSYTCTVATPGTGCSGSQTASTTVSTSVSTFGAGASSAQAGNAASTAWTLVNDPLYRTGAYSATVTYTISAT